MAFRAETGTGLIFIFLLGQDDGDLDFGHEQANLVEKEIHSHWMRKRLDAANACNAGLRFCAFIGEQLPQVASYSFNSRERHSGMILLPIFSWWITIRLRNRPRGAVSGGTARLLKYERLRQRKKSLSVQAVHSSRFGTSLTASIQTTRVREVILDYTTPPSPLIAPSHDMKYGHIWYDLGNRE